MDRLKLQVILNDFLDVVMESIAVQDSTDDHLTRKETTAMWVRLPDCQLTPMFLGFALARGVDINTFNPIDIEHALKTLGIGDDGVDFDWIGECDATDKPH